MTAIAFLRLAAAALALVPVAQVLRGTRRRPRAAGAPASASPTDGLGFDAMLEAAPDAMVLVDDGGRIVMVNGRTERLFGFSREDLVGHPVEILVPDRFKTSHAGHRQHYHRRPAVRPMDAGLELYGRRKDGGEFPVDVSLSPLRVGDRALVMSAIRDVTERVRVQQALLERTRALEAAQEDLVRKERLATLGQLAGGVSHELRNPLGVIKNAVYYLTMVVPDDPRARKHLGIIEREVASANRIITGLLDFARARPASPAPTDLNRLVEEHLARGAPAEPVQVELRLAEALPPALVDAGQIDLVLGNLVTNAVQAMPDGGVLSIETREAAGEVRLAVADTGKGISAADLPKIFEPLFTTKAKGIGLGLSVVRRLVQANGGTIAVESEEGRGSRFEVRVPAADREAASP